MAGRLCLLSIGGYERRVKRTSALIASQPILSSNKIGFLGLRHSGWNGLLYLATLLASGCTCENSEVKSAQNSTGELRAVLFVRNCGATTDFSTQISVLSVGQSLSKEAGNLFIADTDSGAARAEEWGGPYASFKWIDERVLAISFDDEAAVFKRVEELDGITVEYHILQR